MTSVNQAAPAWHAVPVAQATAELARLNGGKPPATLVDMACVAYALGFDIHVVPAWAVPDALLQRSKRVILLGQAPEATMSTRALHELAELITLREGGEPPYEFCGEDGHHNIACAVEAGCAGLHDTGPQASAIASTLDLSELADQQLQPASRADRRRLAELLAA